MTEPTRISLIGSAWPRVPSAKTMMYTAQFVDQDERAIPAAALTAVTLTLLAPDGTVVNSVDHVSVLNTGRGVVDASGNFTITLGSVVNAADTRLTVPTDDEEQRSMVIDWTYSGGTMTGAKRVDFLIVGLGAT